jgi:hypothetical protein
MTAEWVLGIDLAALSRGEIFRCKRLEAAEMEDGTEKIWQWLCT